MSDGDPRDNGETRVNPEDAALIVTPEGGLTLLMPHYEDDEDVPRLVAALGMVAVKLLDPAFVSALLAEIDDEEEEEDHPFPRRPGFPVFRDDD